LGIIQKQTIKGSIYSYFGVVLGFITTALLYPKVFSTSEVGLLRLLVAYSALFAQFSTLGFSRVTTMLFPWFRDKANQHNGFFYISLIVSLAGLILSIVLLLILRNTILETGQEDSELFSQYFYYIIPLIVFTLSYTVFDTYYKVLYNSVQGTVLKDFVQRIIILAGVILYFFELISFFNFILILLFAFFIPAVVLMIILMIQKEFFLKSNFGFITPHFKKKMFNVSLYGIVASFTGILVLNIDSIMINAFLDLSSTGIYAVTFFFGTVILIPSRSLLKISGVIIADSWKKNDLTTINTIYYKSCINQLILASILFIGIWGNVHNLFNEYLLPPEYEAGKYVIFFISLASLIQMAGGTSNMILFTSHKYKVHTYFMFVLVILLVGTNYLFIPAYGIVGAAIASAFSFLIFNLIKYLYLRKSMRFNPYDYKSLIVILIAVGVYFLTGLIKPFENIFIDLAIRSSIMALCYFLLIYFTRVSDEVNGAVSKYFNIILKK
jgi:O-antigen/teichoic acid export membrane protein